MADSIYDVSMETLNAATYWVNQETGRECIPVDGILVAIT